MAVKKTAKKDEPATPAKAATPDTTKTSTPKAKAPKAAAAAPTPAPAKAEPKAKPAEPKAAPAAAKAAKPKVAPIKITDSQAELLKRVHDAGEKGYGAEKKVEERSLEALLGKKLIKKGAKDKATGKLMYLVSTAGKKHVEGLPAAGTS